MTRDTDVERSPYIRNSAQASASVVGACEARIVVCTPRSVPGKHPDTSVRRVDEIPPCFGWDRQGSTIQSEGAVTVCSVGTVCHIRRRGLMVVDPSWSGTQATPAPSSRSHLFGSSAAAAGTEMSARASTNPARAPHSLAYETSPLGSTRGATPNRHVRLMRQASGRDR